MGLNAQPVVQLASFSETFVFDTLNPAIPETGSATLVSVSVTTTPSFASDGTTIVPANVTVSDATTSTEIRATISGSYGLGIALEDVYKTITYTTPTSSFVTQYDGPAGGAYDLLEADTTYSHLTDFLPQNWSYKTYVYTFLVVKIPGGSSTRTVTQEVYPDMNRHVPRIVSLIEREIV